MIASESADEAYANVVGGRTVLQIWKCHTAPGRSVQSQVSLFFAARLHGEPPP